MKSKIYSIPVKKKPRTIFCISLIMLSLNGIAQCNNDTQRHHSLRPNGCVNTSADFEIKGTQSDGLRVYPNPSNGQFKIRYYNPTGAQVILTVYDAAGTKIYSRKSHLSAAYASVDINMDARHSSGTYIAELRDAGGKVIATKSIIVLR